MATKKETAGSASSANFRRTWDVAEYQEKAREKDREAREHAQEAEEAKRKGKKAPRKKQDVDLPKPTEKAKAREGSLELDKNLNKIMVVNASAGRGPGQPGYYCDVCSRNHKDSQSYLDHLNGRSHLKRLGQTTRVAKSTLDQVRIKIAQLREQSREAAEKKEYDFATRLKEIKAAEDNDKVARREQKKEAKALKKAQEDVKPVLTEDEQQMQAMMGFSGFGPGK